VCAKWFTAKQHKEECEKNDHDCTSSVDSSTHVNLLPVCALWLWGVKGGGNLMVLVLVLAVVVAVCCAWGKAVDSS
jgi:hypothetical protein